MGGDEPGHEERSVQLWPRDKRKLDLNSETVPKFEQALSCLGATVCSFWHITKLCSQMEASGRGASVTQMTQPSSEDVTEGLQERSSFALVSYTSFPVAISFHVMR